MAKADFDHIYTAPDPRAYFDTLGGLDYQIPGHGVAIFDRLANQIAEQRDLDRVHIVDLCCSYGVNGAMLKHDVTFPEMRKHYADDGCEGLERDELVARDRRWFGQRQLDKPRAVFGLDTSSAAIDYAVDAGFIDDGAAEDLEADPPSADLVQWLKDADLVTVTGGIGYITERTIGQVLDACGSPPWLAAMCLRWIDFTPIAEVGAKHGLITERLDGVTFPQRRFFDSDEQDYVLAELERQGIDPTGREADGYHHADLYLLRPEPDVAAVALDDLIGTVHTVDQ